LFKEDLSQEEERRRMELSRQNKLKIYGQPLPALFPEMIQKLDFDFDDPQNMQLMAGYTSGPEYLNLFHFLSMNNNGFLMN